MSFKMTLYFLNGKAISVSWIVLGNMDKEGNLDRQNIAEYNSL